MIKYNLSLEFCLIIENGNKIRYKLCVVPTGFTLVTTLILSNFPIHVDITISMVVGECSSLDLINSVYFI